MPAKIEHDRLFFDADGEFKPEINRGAYWAASENADLTCAETDMELGSNRYYLCVISSYESLTERDTEYGA